MVRSFVNYQPCSEISVTDRALNYGHGVFTTGLVINHRFQYQHLHLKRLQMDCARLGIHFDGWSRLSSFLSCQAAGFDQPVMVKVLITGGLGGSGYRSFGASAPQVIVQFRDTFRDYRVLLSRGLTLGWSAHGLADCYNSVGSKDVNRIEQVMAIDSVEAHDVDDLIVLDERGFMIETSCMNLFFEISGTWFTPELNRCGVKGIARQLLLDQFECLGLTVNEMALHQSQRPHINSVIACNMVSGPLPVRQWQGVDQQAISLSIDTDLITTMHHTFHSADQG